jgi:hypothetical protein
LPRKPLRKAERFGEVGLDGPSAIASGFGPLTIRLPMREAERLVLLEGLSLIESEASLIRGEVCSARGVMASGRGVLSRERGSEAPLGELPWLLGEGPVMLTVLKRTLGDRATAFDLRREKGEEGLRLGLGEAWVVVVVRMGEGRRRARASRFNRRRHRNPRTCFCKNTGKT